MSELSPVPVNLQAGDVSDAAVSAAADYAFTCGKHHRQKTETWGKGLAGQRVLELGPGSDFGSTLFMACFGAEVAVADQWLSPWSSEHHRPLYTRLADLIAEAFPEADTTPLRRIVEADRYLPDVIQLIPGSAETLKDIDDGVFDIVISNAVYEHIPDVVAASARLAEITAPGGLHVHQIDMRDHQTFDTPLEYLLMSAEEEDAFQRVNAYHLGALRREPEYAEAFAKAGFETIFLHRDVMPDSAYLDGFIPRLRATANAKYRDCPREQLEIVGACYILRRPV